MKVLEKEIRIDSDIREDAESQIQELNELQLALIGGGCGEVVFH